MDVIADGFLLIASIFATGYCYILSRRLRRFTALESGMGGAIAVLSAQVDEMTRVLDRARQIASGTEHRLKDLVSQATVQTRRLEFMTAALHDLPHMDTDEARSTITEAGERQRILRRRNRGAAMEAAE